MKVHFVTLENLKESMLKGMEIGDIGILYINSDVYIWINQYDTCTYILETGIIPTCYSQEIACDFICDTGIIFSYNGVTRRKGKLSILLQLVENIDNNDIKELLRNFISILEYKEDRLNSSLVLNLLNMKIVKKELSGHDFQNYTETCVKDNGSFHYETEDNSNMSKDCVKSIVCNNPLDYYFYDFLNDDCKNIWKECYNRKLSARDIFKVLKSEHQLEFSKAFKAFISEYKDLNLYSLKSNEKLEEDISTNSCNRIKELNFLYGCLEKNGFIQIEDDKWEDSNGSFYIINIKKE